MNQETFSENFELLADAPNGVQKLRELILQMAVQGKIVPQDPHDEPAWVLLEKIRDEKERLVKEKKIKKGNALAPVLKKEYPYELPFGWQWSRLGDYTYIIMGQSPESKYYNKEGIGLPFYQGKTNFGKLYPTPSNWCENPKKIAEKNDILISVRAPVGPTNICNEVSCIGRGLTSLRSLSGANYFYLLYSLRAFEYQISELGVGSTFTAISKNHLDNFLIPIPPLNEQKRIVAKVDQLMALCDELEARQQKKHEKRIRLNNAALDKLLTAPTTGEFAQHWQRICDNFDLLYDAPETVGQLRQAILQLAVQGKLVAQDEGDEPASVLLEEIKSEKKQLVKDKKIRKVKPLPPIKENEISYKLPDKWEWARLGDALLKITDGTHHSPPNGPKGEFKYITAKNIKSGGINLSNITYVSKAMHEEIYNRCDPESGDILYIKDGATTGIVTINELNEQFSMLSSVALLKNPSKIYNRYLLYVLRSPYFYSLMRDDMSGVAITRVTLTKLNRALIPLAPFEEQKRIVAKVNQLMALCDELEAGLVQAQTDGGKLMEAVVHHVLAA